jgi:hypothetical protein
LELELPRLLAIFKGTIGCRPTFVISSVDGDVLWNVGAYSLKIKKTPPSPDRRTDHDTVIYMEGANQAIVGANCKLNVSTGAAPT